jgi:hypothetical protein
MATNVVNVSDEVLADDAFARVKPELAKLAPEDLLQVNLDVAAALQTILGVLPEVKRLRSQIAKELPSFDLASFDRLEDYALALGVCQTAVLMATQPQDDVHALAEEAVKLRETLAADAQALGRRNLIDGGQLAGLKGVNGYKNIAQDLLILSKVMQDAWPNIQGKSATTTEDLKTASQMSTRLSRIVGLREQGPAQLAAVTDLRLRAFTLALRTYEDARRAVHYLRARAGDADTIIPSLYPGRPRRRPSEVSNPAQPKPPHDAPGGTGSTQPGTAADAHTSQALPAVASAGKGPFLQ